MASIARLVVILDACCLINLVAAGQVAAILRTYPARFVVARRVIDESGFILRGGDGPDAADLVPIDLSPLVADGIITVVEPESDTEIATWITLAAQIDDGEAMTGAVAHHRGYTVATDDRRCRSVLGRLEPPVALLQTSALLKHWADRGQINTTDLRNALIAVQQRARFQPGNDDPLAGWWMLAASRQ